MSEGINNAISNVAANEADQVRQCLAPLRMLLIQIMQSQLQPGTTTTRNIIYILTPDEDSIVKALASTKGYFNRVGEAVAVDKIQSATGLGDIRYRAAMRLLNDNFGQGQPASLLPPGDEYALRVGFAK